MTARNKAPWEAKGSCLMLLGLTVFMSLTFLGIFFTVMAVLDGPMRDPPLEGWIGEAIAGAGTLMLGIGGMVKINKWVGIQAVMMGDWKVKRVDPSASGEPFTIRLLGGTIFSGKMLFGNGTCTFYDDYLEVTGFLPPSIWVYLLVIGAVSVVCSLIYGGIVILGVVPTAVALALAYRIWRTPSRVRIPYSSITSLNVNGRVVKMETKGVLPQVKGFIVASADAERLYRELHRHYPKAVSEWEEWFEEEHTS